MGWIKTLLSSTGFTISVSDEIYDDVSKFWNELLDDIDEDLRGTKMEDTGFFPICLLSNRVYIMIGCQSRKPAIYQPETGTYRKLTEEEQKEYEAILKINQK